MTTPYPKPFDVKADVMVNIRPLKMSDVQRVAELHHAAMGNSLWSQLGQRFLRALYRGLLGTPQFIGFVYEDPSSATIEGFIAGSTNTETMFKTCFKASAPRLGITALLGIRSVGVARRLIETFRYFDDSALAFTTTAESLFCSFTPKLRGKRVSGHINKVLFDTLCAEGFQAVKITTEVDNIGANRQLQSWGFQVVGQFQFYGKEMIGYQLIFDQSDRVEAKDWRS